LSTFGIYNNTPVIKQVSYATGATTSQEAIVTGLKTAWDALMAYEATPFAIMERMSNGTRAAFTAGTGDATGVKPVNGSTMYHLLRLLMLLLHSNCYYIWVC